MSGNPRLCFRTRNDSTGPLEAKRERYQGKKTREREREKEGVTVTASYDRLVGVYRSFLCHDDARGRRGGDAG